VTSVDAKSLVLLQSIHDELTSSSEGEEGLASEIKCQQANKAHDTDDKDTSL
jgi:hypothetical protein